MRLCINSIHLHLLELHYIHFSQSMEPGRCIDDAAQHEGSCLSICMLFFFSECAYYHKEGKKRQTICSHMRLAWLHIYHICESVGQCLFNSSFFDSILSAKCMCVRVFNCKLFPIASIVGAFCVWTNRFVSFCFN